MAVVDGQWWQLWGLCSGGWPTVVKVQRWWGLCNRVGGVYGGAGGTIQMVVRW
ncbi:hypothetical protein HanPSC8_Chr01g0026941 [Helianthus annuus]|nr:hypothetical protein HanPSC8_Chr01g0026941 [Helianthus annuus]